MSRARMAGLMIPATWNHWLLTQMRSPGKTRSIPRRCASRDDVDLLFRSFQRLGNDRTTHPGGHGLGLSIVRVVVTAHDAGLKIQLRPSGRLIVQIFFPLSPVPGNNHGDVAVPATTDIQRVRRAGSPIEK